MVANYAGSICCGELWKLRIFILPFVQRAPESGFERTIITKAGRTAEDLELSAVRP